MIIDLSLDQYLINIKRKTLPVDIFIY